jgi:hypothetical protein
VDQQSLGCFFFAFCFSFFPCCFRCSALFCCVDALRRSLSSSAASLLRAAAGSGGYLPKITDHGLAHSFGGHAKQWFGRETSAADQETWKQLVERATRSREIVAWSAKRTPTFGHLARIEGKYFFVQFDQRTGDLVTAFVPNNSQLTAILRKLRS